MDDYLAKPLELAGLALALERTGTAKADAEADDEGDGGVPAFDPSPLDELLEVMGDAGPELVRNLVSTFLDEAPRLLAAAAEAEAAGRVDEVQRAAHSLKPSSAGLGAMRLAAACRRLEAAAKEGEAELGPLVEAAVTAYGEARPLLEERLPLVER